MITKTPVEFIKDALKGEQVLQKRTCLKDLQSMYKDSEAVTTLAPDTVLYNVEAYLPVPEGTTAGLFFGITKINPGQVGNEYYFTRGHFHELPDRGEFYWGIEGEGMLILMDEQRNCRAEKMYPGSLHYIPGHTAHRVANTGQTILSFGACWPSDAGHNYKEIMDNGFSARLLNIDGEATLVIP